MSRKNDPEFQALIEKCVKLDVNAGLLSFEGLYASLAVNIRWKQHVLPIPYSHIVFLLANGRWPRHGYHLDHINNNPMDNRPINLDEVTEEDNHKKRRGRLVYRSYGTGKYGYGIIIHHDRRDDRYYITRHLSRGHGNGDLKAIRKSLGGFNTLEEAEAQVAIFIEQIKEHGLDYMPDSVGTRLSWKSLHLRKMSPRICRWRAEGQTIQEIARKTDFSEATIHKVVKDMGIDNRVTRTPKA
jgi:hypothetical protein